jgi:hypothetical protein
MRIIEICQIKGFEFGESSRRKLFQFTEDVKKYGNF